MNRTCNNCASERVAPVLDKRIENRARAGNKFRTRCLHCGHWNPMCSRADFLMTHAKDDDTAYVLPADTDPENVDGIVPIAEYDGKIKELREGRFRANLPEREETERDEKDEETNQFTCPAAGCDAENTGQPDECPSCGVVYGWPAEEAA